MQFIPHLYSVSRKSCAQVRRESLDDSIPYSYRPFLSFSPTWNYTILQRQRTKNPSSHSPFYIINIHIDITIFPNPKREGNKFRKNIYTKNYLFTKLYKNVNKDQYFISTIHHFSLFFHKHCSTKLFKKKIVHDKNLQIRRSFETSSQKTSRVKVVPLEIRPYSREGRRKEGRRGAGFHSPFPLHGDAETQFSPLSTFLCRVLVRYSPLPSRNSMNCAVSSSQCRGFSPRFMVIPWAVYRQGRGTDFDGWITDEPSLARPRQWRHLFDSLARRIFFRLFFFSFFISFEKFHERISNLILSNFNLEIIKKLYNFFSTRQELWTFRLFVEMDDESFLNGERSFRVRAFER